MLVFILAVLLVLAFATNWIMPFKISVIAISLIILANCTIKIIKTVKGAKNT